MSRVAKSASRSRSACLDRVETQRSVALFKQPRPLQAAVLVFEALLAPVLGDHQRSRRENSRRLSQHSQRGRILLGRIVRRIQIHHFVASWLCHSLGNWFCTCFRGSTQERRHAFGVHRESALDAQPLQIAPQHLERRWRPFHKRHARRPAAQRLDPHCSRAGKQITISDTGVGIPQNQQEKVFSKLFRASNVAAMGANRSTGLGLYLTKSIVEALGGRISFISEENKGSAFTIIL